jgi:hypothetical protein
MTTLSLRGAAELAGVNKSTIFRAIQKGRLSAARTDTGDFAIDPAELLRVYPPKSEQHHERHDATGEMTELRVRNARLEGEVAALRELAEELRRTRDAFERQLTMALSKPEPKPEPERKPEPTAEPARRGLFGWFRRAS